MKTRILSLATALLLGTTFASAQVAAFSDRSAWLSHVNVSFSDNYESYPVDQSLSGSYLGPILYTNPATYGQVLIEGANITYDAPYLNSTYLEYQNDPSIVIDFGSSVTAVGFDFGQFYGTVVPLQVFLDGNVEVDAGSANNAYAFLGITSTTPFSSITLVSSDFPLLLRVQRAPCQNHQPMG
jgi:hypothetical protein